MPFLERAGGRLRVSYPASYEVAPEPPATARRGAGPFTAPGPTGPARPADDVCAALLASFATQGLEVVAPFALVPATPATPAGPPGNRPPRPSRPGKVRVELDLAKDQDAVILTEQDGLFSWQVPTGHDPAPTTARHPGAGSSQVAASRDGAPRISRVALFEIDVRPFAPARPARQPRPARPGTSTGAGGRPVLGSFGDYVVGPVTAYVLTFVSRAVPGALISFLERNVHPGLVLMTGADVHDWPLVDNLTQVSLPQDRPAKILVCVPGTFSTTVGSYGVLTSTTQGQAFLSAAAGSYDAVIGFDHYTLSRDPLENAIDLHSRLKARTLTFTPAIDVVSYSRGGLVARSLIEYVLPSSSWHADLGAVAFVAATNAGTLLAEPDSWKVFLDLYTNLAAGVARSIAYATGAAPAAEIVSGLVSGIGAFVEFLVTAVITDDAIPGLAAMEPDGPFITGINGTQPGQPVAGTPWYVVSSDFEPSLFDDTHEPPELPAELIAKLADGLVDQLMGVQNDLVVNTASMGAIERPRGAVLSRTH